MLSNIFYWLSIRFMLPDPLFEACELGFFQLKINKMEGNVMLLLPIYFNITTIFLVRTKSTCHCSLQNHHIIKHIAHSEDDGHFASALTCVHY